MKIYKLDNSPSKEEYIQGFNHIKERISKNQLCLLQKQYYSPNKIVTATQLAELAEIKGGRPVVNSLYGRLGHSLSDAMGLKPNQSKSGDYSWWSILSSGYVNKNNFYWQMYEEVALALEALGWVNQKLDINNTNYVEKEIDVPQAEYIIKSNVFLQLPDELSDETEIKNLYEGAKQSITVNRYERNHEARKKCIEYYGKNCYVCGFDFENVFGEIGQGFIHVYHLIPLSKINQEYEVDPIKDLRPVCPNCHAMIHRKNPPFSIEEIKNLLKHDKQCLD